MREQLWRYYPQFLAAVRDDVAAPWALDLWQCLPTPARRPTGPPVGKARHPPNRYCRAAPVVSGGGPGSAGCRRSCGCPCAAPRRAPLSGPSARGSCASPTRPPDGRPAESTPADDSNASEEPSHGANRPGGRDPPAVPAWASARASSPLCWPKQMTCCSDQTTPRCAVSAAWRHPFPVPAVP